MRLAGTVVAVLSVLAGGGFAADPPAPQPPQSVEARLAKARYDEAVAKAQKEFDRTAAAARKLYVEELTTAQKAATKAEQLDEAVRIRDWKTLVEQGKDGSSAKGGRREGAVSFGGSQYKVVLAEGGWLAARERCQKLGGDLAVIDTKEKREFLGKLNESVELWVGASKDKDGKWTWVNGHTVDADAWLKGRPEGGGHTSMFPQGLVCDCKEDHPFVKGFVCEWKK